MISGPPFFFDEILKEHLPHGEIRRVRVCGAQVCGERLHEMMVLRGITLERLPAQLAHGPCLVKGVPEHFVLVNGVVQLAQEAIDDAIDQNKMLRHPFYQTWTMGKLSREALKGYAAQYHHFVQAFPTYRSATHANTPDLSVRQVLLENLI